MKLAGRQASGYFGKPETHRSGLLIYGADAMRVALKRQQVIAALIGPEGEAEMRLTRIAAGELRKDPAMLNDAIKAQSFFPGPRVAFVEDAADGLTKIITAALEDWADGDAQIIVTANQLRASSSLRKLFEKHPNAYAAGIYDDPPSRDEIEAELRAAGLRDLPRDVLEALGALARMIPPGDFRQTLEKIALYKFGDDSPLTPDEIDLCAPLSQETGVDDVLNCVAEGRAEEIGPVMQRLRSQGIQPVSLCINATRHFKLLYTAASDPGGVSAGMGKLRPPVYGPRRDRLQRQAARWGAQRAKRALSMLTDVDLQLRSANQNAPAMELVERTMVRLAMVAQR